MTITTLEQRWERFAKSLSKEWTAEQIAGAQTAFYSGATAAMAEIAHHGASANSGSQYVGDVTASIERMINEVREYMLTRRRAI